MGVCSYLLNVTEISYPFFVPLCLVINLTSGLLFYDNSAQESNTTENFLFLQENFEVLDFMQFYLAGMLLAGIITHPSWSSSKGTSSKKPSRSIPKTEGSIETCDTKQDIKHIFL